MFHEATSVKEAEDNERDHSTENEQELSTAELAKGYEYLLGMKIWSLTFEKAEALRADRDSKKAQLEALEITTPNEIWLKDLDAIELALDNRDAAIEAALKEEKEARDKSEQAQTKAGKKKPPRKTAKKRKSSDDAEGMESNKRHSALTA